MGVSEKAFHKIWRLRLTGEAEICQVKKGGEDVLIVME